MDRNGGARAAILTMLVLMLVFVLSAASLATLQEPGGVVRAGMACLVLSHLAYVLLEAKFVNLVPLPPPLYPAPPQVPGSDDSYRAPPPSLASAYSSTQSGSSVDDAPAGASPPEEYSYLASSESDERVTRSSRNASTPRGSSRRSSSTASTSSRSRGHLSDSDLTSSDEAKHNRGGKTNNVYIELKLILRRSAAARRRSRRPSTATSSSPSPRRHLSDSDLSSGSRSSGRRSSCASAGKASKRHSRSRRARGGKKNAYSKLKRMFFKGKR